MMKNFSHLCFPCDSSGSIHQQRTNESSIMFYFLQQSFMLIQSSQTVFSCVDSCTKTLPQIQLSPFSLEIKFPFFSFIFFLFVILVRTRRMWFSCWFWSSIRYSEIHNQWNRPQWELPRILSFIFLQNSRVIRFCSGTISYRNKTMISIGS